MRIKNTEQGYGLVTILLHWFMALLIVGLFVLGVYMVELGYYDNWYNAAPWWHKSVGMLVFALFIVRVAWVLLNRHPTPLPGYQRLEVWMAGVTHIMFYILILAVCLSGYLITTAKGAGVDIFGWFEFPAVTTLTTDQAEFFGDMHALASYLMGLFFAMHMVATCKHHFSDRDATLVRILNPAYKGDKQ